MINKLLKNTNLLLAFNFFLSKNKIIILLYQFTINHISATLKFIFCGNDIVRLTRWTHIHHHIKGWLQFSDQKQSLNKAISLSIWAWPHFFFSCSPSNFFSPLYDSCDSYFMVLSTYRLFSIFYCLNVSLFLLRTSFHCL